MFPHPCRCLWRGSEQITRTTPFRLTILQLRQIFFTDALTFIIRSLLRLPGSSSTTEIRLLQQTLVLVTHHVRLELGHEIHRDDYDD